MTTLVLAVPVYRMVPIFHAVMTRRPQLWSQAKPFPACFPIWENIIVMIMIFRKIFTKIPLVLLATLYRCQLVGPSKKCRSWVCRLSLSQRHNKMDCRRCLRCSNIMSILRKASKILRFCNKVQPCLGESKDSCKVSFLRLSRGLSSSLLSSLCSSSRA